MADYISRDAVLSVLHEYWRLAIENAPSEMVDGVPIIDEQTRKMLAHNKTLSKWIKAIPSSCERPRRCGEIIDIVDVKKAVKNGQIEARARDGIIFLRDLQTGEVVKVGEYDV